jgi:hypothetical protein
MAAPLLDNGLGTTDIGDATDSAVQVPNTEPGGRGRPRFIDDDGHADRQAALSRSIIVTTARIQPRA